MDVTAPSVGQAPRTLCWHGDPAAWERLYIAVLRHCAEPVRDAEGTLLAPCLGCSVCLQLFDQRALDRLALVGKYRETFVQGDDHGGGALDATDAAGETCTNCRVRRRRAKAALAREQERR